VCNRYPNVTLEYEVVDADEVGAGEAVTMSVKLERDNDAESEHVHAPLYPKEKEEGWWLLVGDTKVPPPAACPRALSLPLVPSLCSRLLSLLLSLYRVLSLLRPLLLPLSLALSLFLAFFLSRLLSHSLLLCLACPLSLACSLSLAFSPSTERLN